MRGLLIILGLIIYSNNSLGQEVNVEREKYPGVKKIITKSVGHGIYRLIGSPYNGYKGVYLLDEKGQAKTETRFKKGKHLATYKYEFLDNGFLAKQTTTFDINNPKTTNTHYYSYDIRDGIVYTEICYKTNDTLYRVDNLEFNDKGLKTKYIRNKNVKRAVESINLLTYDNSLIKSWESIETDDSTRYFYVFKYDQHGQRIEINETWTSKTEILGSKGGTEIKKFKFKYDGHGRWTKKYEIIGNRKHLTEKRKYSM